MAKKKKLGTKIYWICLLAYVLILSGAAVYLLNKVWGYAEEYEKSRPNNTMDAYVAELSENLWDDSIAETIAAMPHEMQSDDDCAEIVKQMLSDGVSYSRVRSENADATTISYKLRCGDSVFGQVTLKEDESKADQSEYGLLPWIVYKEEFDFTGLYTSVQVMVPASYSVELNGNKLGSEYIIEEGIQYDVLEGYYEDYPDLPTKVTYKFDNVIGHLEPVVYDESGNEFIVDESKDDSQYIKPVDDGTKARLQEFADVFVERYKSYISGIYSPDYGYQRLQPYMKLGSDLDERMKLAMDGIGWAHTSSVTINSVVLNNAIDIGQGIYIIDISSNATVVATQGQTEQAENMKLIVTDTGSDIRAVTLELY